MSWLGPRILLILKTRNVTTGTPGTESTPPSNGLAHRATRRLAALDAAGIREILRQGARTGLQVQKSRRRTRESRCAGKPFQATDNASSGASRPHRMNLS